jgi:hypothetical protein
MANVEPLPSGEPQQEEGQPDRSLVLLAERLLSEPELVAWLRPEPQPGSWPDDDGPLAA